MELYVDIDIATVRAETQIGEFAKLTLSIRGCLPVSLDFEH